MQAVASGQIEPVDGKGPKAASLQASAPWYAIWTHSHCEQLVSDQLAAKGFELFFPRASVTASRGRRVSPPPLFPGYVFVNHAIDKTSYVEIIKARGVVRVLGDRWDALAPVSTDEIEAVRRVMTAGAPVLAHPHLTEGDRVRITAGPLAGISGLFVRSKNAKGLLILSVKLLQRSLAVEVPGDLVEVA